MKLKYYLRGLGIGIICTAIIMGIAFSGNKKETMTDTEIIERARLLGMVMPEDTDESSEPEEQDLSDNKTSKPEEKDNSGSKNTAGDGKKDDQINNKAEDNDGSGADKAQGSQQGENPSDSTTADSAQTDNNGQQKPAQEMVQIEIKKGEFSDTVCQKLFQAGLISDAEAFNSYLTQKGVDQSLRTGVYQFPVGATQDQIIEILQKKE